EMGLFEQVWCLTPGRLARSYAYQILVTDELTRHGVQIRYVDAPPNQRRCGGDTAGTGPRRDRRVRTGEDRGTQPSRQALSCSCRGDRRMAGPLWLQTLTERAGGPQPPGDL